MTVSRSSRIGSTAGAVRWIMLYDYYLPTNGTPERGRKIENKELRAYYSTTSIGIG